MAALLLPFALTACGDEEDSIYPSIVTNIVSGTTTSTGTLASLITDYDDTLALTNPQAGLRPDSTYRLLCGYVVNGNEATLYNATSVYLLRDKRQIDTTTIVSQWTTPKYVNYHLSLIDEYQNHYDAYASIPIR